MNNNSLLLLCLLLIGSAYCEYASACDSEISHPIMVEVPLNADPRQTALIVANAVLDDVNNLHPHETRCNVAIFAFTVTLKRGFFICDVTTDSYWRNYTERRLGGHTSRHDLAAPWAKS